MKDILSNYGSLHRQKLLMHKSDNSFASRLVVKHVIRCGEAASESADKIIPVRLRFRDVENAFILLSK